MVFRESLHHLLIYKSLLGNHISDKSEEKFNSFMQKEMEIENIQFGDDSFLFTDLDSVNLDFDLKIQN